MKKLSLLLSLFLLFFSPIAESFELIAQKPKHGFFDDSPICSPTLTWPAAQDAAVVSYDVVVYEALTPRDSGPVPGKQVFYKEKVDANSIQVSPPLGSPQKYLWTYRYRKKNGETSSWASYSKKFNHLIQWGEYHGVFFGFQTKDCKEAGISGAVQPGDHSKVYKKLKSDKEIASLLESGMSGIVLPYSSFIYGKKEADFVRESKSIEQIESKIKRSHLNGTHLIVYAPGKKKEERLGFSADKLFILLAQPGEYIVTHFEIDLYVETLSFKLDLRIPVEKGKLKYAGDLILLAMKDWGFSNMEVLVPMRPELFLNFMKEKYPQTVSHIVFYK